MDTGQRLRYLAIALRVFGAVFVVAVLPLSIVWPAGWAWHEPGESAAYLHMIIAIYAVLGIYMIRAAKDPLANRSLIGFVIWSSVAHGGLMAVQSLVLEHQHGHLTGDVPALLLVAAVLAWLLPRPNSKPTSRSEIDA